MTAAQNVVKALAPIIKPIVNLTNNVIITLLGRQGAAAFGAMILDMEEETMYNSFKDRWSKGENKWDITSCLGAKFSF